MQKIAKSIEVFFLESLLKITLASIIIVMLVDYAFNRFEVVRSLIVNGAVLFAILTTYLFHRKGHFTFAVIWIGAIILAAMFYQSIAADAITTSSMAVVMVVGFGFSTLLRGKLPLILHILTLFGMTLVFGWLALHPQRYQQPNASDIIVAGVTYGILYAIIAYSSRILKLRYDAVVRDVGVKAMEIEAQNEELLQSQESLHELNQHLERMVQDRTQEIQKQNERLIRYAFSNAHHVRGPVARILGLIQLSKMDTELKNDFLFARVEEQALEIDHVVRGINRELEV